MPEDKMSVRPSSWDRTTAISTLVLAIVGAVALYVAIAQIREMREEARIQHLAAFIDRFDSPERIAIRKNLAVKRIDQTSKRLRQLDVVTPPIELDEELEFCDDMGLFTKHGYLDRHDVWSEFSTWLFYLYADARPYLDNLQSKADYSECRNLVENIRPIEINEGGSTYDHPSESDLYTSYLSDIERQTGQSAYRVRTPKKH